MGNPVKPILGNITVVNIATRTPDHICLLTQPTCPINIINNNNKCHPNIYPANSLEQTVLTLDKSPLTHYRLAEACLTPNRNQAP